MKYRLAKVVWLSLLLGIVLAGATARAADPGPSEYQVKAAFLYNFAKFIKWPETAFAETNSPLIIDILGDDPFGPSLELAVKGKTINGHPLSIRLVNTPAEIKFCHVLFISRKPPRNLANAIAALNHSNTLTVSEADGFLEAGGMINFVMEGTKVRFEIKDAAATRAGLTISSKLLSVALKRERSG